MSRHLSPQQVSQWVIGERAAETLEHVRACSSCRTEVEAFDRTLTQFRLSVREEAAAQTPTVWGWQPAPPRILWRFLTACATVAIVLGAGWLANSPGRHSQQDSAAADAALLKQIDADVSQAVPDSMEPLLRLVASDTVPANQTPGRAKDPGKSQER